MTTEAPLRPGDRVTYAGGLYEVRAVYGDLVSLVGVATWDGRAARYRPAMTVLAEDVERVEEG